MPDRDRQPYPGIDALVVAARTDRAAFGQLYQMYYERILGYCYRRLNQRAAAEDVCSDTFLYVARKMSAFRGDREEDFRRWVYRIATNQVNAHLRRKLRRKELWDTALQQERIRVNGFTNSSGPTQSLDWSVVYQAIARLRAKEQTVVTLRLLEEIPHDEIAQIMKIRPGTVRVIYSRALKKLREEILAADGASTNTSFKQET
jgi:RNA polymerase sigma-70 factor (ECF subfamily)